MYCPISDRYFLTEVVLAGHLRKVHKKQKKRVAEKQYTQEEAEAAAGLGQRLKCITDDSAVVVDSTHANNLK